jgi:nucleoside-diphosphate-sugar epimerase
MARDRAASLGDRVRLAEGDITVRGFAMADTRLAEEVTEVFHLAAIYDLAVSREAGMRVNVEGTRNVLAFAEQCPNLRRFHYVSTCYVSGAWPGVFTEQDLDVGQRFNNYYEETKFLAEMDVQAAMGNGLPATIYRPAIVVGDSRTGETQKFDGPYFVIRWILRQPRLAVLPMVGPTRQVRLNVVPRDFIAEAIPFLAALDRSKGKVYQLADPRPATIHEMIELIGQASGRKIVRIPLTRGLARFAIERIPGVDRLLQIPSVLVDYLVHPTTYDTSNTLADLRGTEIAVPPFSSYVGRLVEFARSHRDIRSGAMT